MSLWSTMSLLRANQSWDSLEWIKHITLGVCLELCGNRTTCVQSGWMGALTTSSPPEVVVFECRGTNSWEVQLRVQVVMRPRKVKDFGLVMLHDQAKGHHQVCNYSKATIKLWQASFPFNFISRSWLSGLVFGLLFFFFFKSSICYTVPDCSPWQTIYYK